MSDRDKRGEARARLEAQKAFEAYQDRSEKTVKQLEERVTELAQAGTPQKDAEETTAGEGPIGPAEREALLKETEEADADLRKAAQAALAD